MHASKSLLFSLLLAVLPVGAASASPVAMQASGTLSLELGAGDPVVIQGSGPVSVDDQTGAFSLPELFFGTSVFIPLTTQVGGTPFSRFPIVSLRLTGPAGNQAGVFSNPSPQAPNAVPLLGTALVGLFTTGSGDFPLASIVVPLAPIGGPGGTAMAAGFGIRVTIAGFPWRTGVAQAGTTMGAQFTRMGFDDRDESFVGTIQYVTPTMVTTNVDGSESLAGFGTLTLHFVPEPSTFLLLAGGMALLGWRGRR